MGKWHQTKKDFKQTIETLKGSLQEKAKNEKRLKLELAGRDGSISALERELEEKKRELIKVIKINADLQKTISQLQNDNYHDKWIRRGEKLVELQKHADEITAPYKERISFLEQSMDNLTGAIARHTIELIRRGDR